MVEKVGAGYAVAVYKSEGWRPLVWAESQQTAEAWVINNHQDSADQMAIYAFTAPTLVEVHVVSDLVGPQWLKPAPVGATPTPVQPTPASNG